LPSLCPLAPRAARSSTMAYEGTVKNFRAEKGFGFITTPEGLDIFLHIKACTDGGVPQTGDVVKYDLEESKIKPGQMQATGVTGGTGTPGAKGGGKGVVGTGTLQGTCKSFNPEKGYGFIQPADGSDNIFFNIKQMQDGSTPQAGDWLTYDVEPSPIKPGQMQGSNVTGGTGWGADKGKGGFGGGKDAWGGKGGGWGKDGGKSFGKSKGDSWGGGGKGGPYDGGKGKGKGWGGDSWGGDAAWGGDASWGKGW